MDNDTFLNRKPKILAKFKVVGLIPSVQFQKCRFLTEKMHECYPEEFAKPEIRAMLNLDWDEYLTKMKRRHGKPYYLLQVPVAVYIDGQFLGDDKDLTSYISKTYLLQTDVDFQEVAAQELIKYFTNIVEKSNRKFAYLTIAIDECVVGSMLFMLYNDLVPITCENFLNRCIHTEEGYSYKRTKIHRIARYSWIQCGGWNLREIHMPCENYSVPHNRRGVLSMCNTSRHTNNSTQFFITLEPADWMDYNYVAFGQLIQGAEILNLIEKVATYYQSPQHKVEITQCGEFTLCPKLDENYMKALNPPYETLFREGVKADEADSVLSLAGYKAGKYNLRTDLKPYMPFRRFSRMFDAYLKDIVTGYQQTEDISAGEDIEEEMENQEIEVERHMSLKKEMFNSKAFYFAGSHVII